MFIVINHEGTMGFGCVFYFSEAVICMDIYGVIFELKKLAGNIENCQHHDCFMGIPLQVVDCDTARDGKANI